MQKKEKESLAQHMEEFLAWVKECQRQFEEAQGAVHYEERRHQDLLHEMEFAPDRDARNRAATKLQQSRRRRRASKDIAMRNELVVQFFGEQGSKSLLKRMAEVSRRQRAQEKYLDGERVYTPRVKEQP